jgi:Ser/Thr protein kinase RdoA (MazF antagonist)
MRNMLARLSARFGIDEPLRVSDAKKGYQGTNFILETRHSKYFLKQYRAPFERAVRDIHRVQEFFSQRGIPVLLPLVTREGAQYVKEAGKFFALYPYIDSKQPERGGLSMRSLHSLAFTLAAIHRIGRGAKGITTNTFRFKSKRQFYADARFILDEISRRKEISAFDEMAEESVRRKLALAAKEDMRFSVMNDHLTHGDYHDANVFFTSDGRVGAVFDFDDSYFGPRSFELVRSIDYICWSSGITRTSIERAQEYLGAYHSRYRISREELLQGFRVYYYRLIHNLWIEKEHYLRGNSRPDPLLMGRLRNLTFFSHNMTRLATHLVSTLVDAPASESVR